MRAAEATMAARRSSFVGSLFSDTQGKRFLSSPARMVPTNRLTSCGSLRSLPADNDLASERVRKSSSDMGGPARYRRLSNLTWSDNNWEAALSSNDRSMVSSRRSSNESLAISNDSVYASRGSSNRSLRKSSADLARSAFNWVVVHRLGGWKCGRFGISSNCHGAGLEARRGRNQEALHFSGFELGKAPSVCTSICRGGC